MTPYYDEDGITIYHGDCREWLASRQDDSVELLISDPPYGVEWQSRSRLNLFSPIIGDDGSLDMRHMLDECVRVLMSRRHLYVFGFDLSGVSGLSATVDLVWDKQAKGLGNLEIPWAPSYERIGFGVKDRGKDHIARGGLVTRLRRESVLRFTRSTIADIHPTEKPVALLRELIESSSHLHECVVDPFAGSGSTLIAAKLEGRRAIGIEVEERYCEIAAKRLAQRVLPFEYASAP